MDLIKKKKWKGTDAKSFHFMNENNMQHKFCDVTSHFLNFDYHYDITDAKLFHIMNENNM